MHRTVALFLTPLFVACGGPSGEHALREEEVQFANGEILLAGTLAIPDGAGPWPAVVLVHGSGPETRRMYLRYAREFASAGIAALAYDKRGAGQSSPANPRAPFDTLAADVLAAVAFLRGHPAVDGRVGLWGLSEGEWVAPLAASRMEQPAFIVLVSASSLTPTEQVRYEMLSTLRDQGYPDSIVSAARALHEGIAEFQRSGAARDPLNVELAKVANERWFEDAAYLDPWLPEYERVLQLGWFPAWRANMDFDALQRLREARAPVLVLLGGKDPKNDAPAAAQRYRALARDGAAPRVDVKIFPDAAHALVEWWLPFRLPPPRYPRGYFETQTAWMRAQLRRE